MNNPSPITVRATRRFGAAPERIKKITMAGVVAALLSAAGSLQAQDAPKHSNPEKGAIKNYHEDQTSQCVRR